MNVRQVSGRLLDRLAARTPDVQPIVFDYTPAMETAARLRAEQATRGVIIADLIHWDEPVPYALTDKA